MNDVRKIVALLLIILIGVPLLFAMIWAAGVTRAVMSPRLLSDLPQAMIREVPDVIDEVLQTARRGEGRMDDNLRGWLTAASAVSISSRQLLEESGVNNWTRTELADSLRRISLMLRAQSQLADVRLDLRPLKRALTHPAVDRYLEQVFANLPACDEAGLAAWRRAIEADHWDRLPACRPLPELTPSALERLHREMSREMPDDVTLFAPKTDFPPGFDLVHGVGSLIWLMFLFPALVIIVAALIAVGPKPAFFRWSGIPTMVAGVLALGLSTLAGRLIPWAMKWAPYEHSHYWSHADPFLRGRLGSLLASWVQQVTSPVMAVAGSVAVVGLVLFALSLAFPAERKESPPNAQG